MQPPYSWNRGKRADSATKSARADFETKRTKGDFETKSARADFETKNTRGDSETKSIRGDMFRWAQIGSDGFRGKREGEISRGGGMLRWPSKVEEGLNRRRLEIIVLNCFTNFSPFSARWRRV